MVKIKKLSPVDHELAREVISLFQEDDGIIEPAVPDEEYLTALLRSNDFCLLVALVGKRPIAGLTAYVLPGYKQAKPKIYLYEIGVQPEWRKREIAKHLIFYLIEMGKTKGIEKIFAETSRHNKAAMRLFESTGAQTGHEVVSYTYHLED